MSESQYPPPGATAYSGATGPAAEPMAPRQPDRPATARGPESLGGLLLILAGITAAASLLPRWLAGEDVSGWNLVRTAFDGLGDIFDDGLWQPLAIVLGGAALLVLGIGMWLPMRSHRFLGLLGLLVSGVVSAAVLVPLSKAGWDLGAFRIGFWLGIAVAVLGLLGSLKALLAPRSFGPRTGG